MTSLEETILFIGEMNLDDSFNAFKQTWTSIGEHSENWFNLILNFGKSNDCEMFLPIFRSNVLAVEIKK